MLERVRNLEAEIARLKAWDSEKGKYELKDVGHGAFAYVRKEDADPREPPHWLCTKCYRDGKGSILLRTETKYGYNILWSCPECSSMISVNHRLTPSQPIPPPAPPTFA
jgi:hypothetical protein